MLRSCLTLLLIQTSLLSVAWGQRSVDDPASLSANLDHQTKTVETVREVLSRAEFRDLQEVHWKLPRWLAHFFESVMGAIGDAIGGLPPWVGVIILIWLVLALVAIIVHLLYVLYTTLAPGPSSGKGSSERDGRPVEILGIRDLEFNAIYRQAQSFIAEKKWFEATKHLYVAAILYLIDKQFLDYVHSKTNRQYLADLQKKPVIADEFASLTQIFEPRVYGETEADESSCTEMNLILQRLANEGA
ncbi:MAG: hypothetical protein KC964_01625 [Candidatus Omnitrophica bacterium]|nr:hypothetical protein [Candidatus Omnitrophota bacterium]